MWIPRPVYELIPYAYLVAGVGSLLAAYFMEHGPRGLLLALGVIGTTVGLVLWMRRRDYRDSHAEYDPRSIDD